ncbi:MAG: hypothetical protein AB1758_14555 [Candidatus Eremiobacterota bacterium]
MKEQRIDTQELARALKGRLPQWVKGVRFVETLDSQGETVLLTFLSVEPDFLIDPGSGKVAHFDNLWEARGTVKRVFVRVPIR